MKKKTKNIHTKIVSSENKTTAAIPNELTASTLEKSRRGVDIQEFESLEKMFMTLGEMKKVSQTRQFHSDLFDK